MSSNLDREHHPIVGLIVRFIFGAMFGGFIWFVGYGRGAWGMIWPPLATWQTLVVVMAGFGLASARYGDDFWDPLGNAASGMRGRWWWWR